MKSKIINTKHMKHLLIILVALMLCQCSRTPKEKKVVLYPSIDIESYEIVYGKSKILIKANGKDAKNSTSWLLPKSSRGYDVIWQGKSFPFLSNQLQFDTTYQIEPYFPKRIVNKKLNDSLYISTINILGPMKLWN